VKGMILNVINNGGVVGVDFASLYLMAVSL
jgi:hypothetical protein